MHIVMKEAAEKDAQLPVIWIGTNTRTHTEGRDQAYKQDNSKTLTLSGRLLINWRSSSGFVRLLVHESETFRRHLLTRFQGDRKTGLRGCCSWEERIVSVSGAIRRQSGKPGTVIYSRRVISDTAFYRGTFRVFPKPFRIMLRYYLQNRQRPPVPRSLSNHNSQYNSFLYNIFSWISVS
jgi:hypothetical protein